MKTTVFSSTLKESTEVLRAIRESDPFIVSEHEALDALRATLTTLRDRLSVEQTDRLAEKLTPLLRGIYYEGWSTPNTEIEMDQLQFLRTVAYRMDSIYPGPIDNMVRLVLGVVSVDMAEADLIVLTQSVLPADVTALIPR